MQFVDTHCHLHDPEFFTAAEAEAAVESAVKSGVRTLLCVGTSLEDSKRAIAFANAHPEHCVASIGIHPHEAAQLSEPEIQRHLKALAELATDPKVVAVGECGFDFYCNSRADSRAKQTQLLKGQLKIAQQHNLPVCFHVREAFTEFWNVFEDFKNISGVLHSFTDTPENLARGLSYNLLIGINGIATFTTHKWQKELFKTVDLSSFVLETDAPFLTPSPKRGSINTPENVIYITNFLAELRGETPQQIAKATTANALKLFGLI